MTTDARNGYGYIFRHNLRSNGPGALVYSYGLSAVRYIEYSTVRKLLAKERPVRVLDVGSGHSLLPSLLARDGHQVSILDINPGAILWQQAKAGNKRSNLKATVASALQMPFSDASFGAVTCISVVEHMKDDGDLVAVREMERVLQDGGVCVISTGIATTAKTADWLRGVPPWLRLMLGERAIKKLLQLFNTDRNQNYYERFYSAQEAPLRFTDGALSLDSCSIYWDWGGVRRLYRFVPMGSLSLLERWLAHPFTKQNGSRDGVGTVILKLRKNIT